MNSSNNITQLLSNAAEGEKSAMDQLFPLVYDELRRVSENQLRGERKNHTINATALVHEAYIRIAGNDNINLQNRNHFFVIAAKCMRDILIDYARKRNAAKRGGDHILITLNEQDVEQEIRAEELIMLDESLEELQDEDPRVSKVVELKFFGGLTYDEIAGVLSVSVPTVRRDWRFARAWLSNAMKGSN